MIDSKSGDIILRMEAGFPANGRTVNAGELEKTLFTFLPVCVRQTLYQKAYKKEELEQVIFLERQIKEQGFEGFIQGQMTGNLAMPRKQELYAALNRCRGLIQIVKKCEFHIRQQTADIQVVFQ